LLKLEIIYLTAGADMNPRSPIPDGLVDVKLLGLFFGDFESKFYAISFTLQELYALLFNVFRKWLIFADLSFVFTLFNWF
jgi:hypothetical protein